MCCSIRQQRAALQNPACEQRWERWVFLHRLLPTLSICHLKRKSEEHKDFPFKVWKVGNFTVSYIFLQSIYFSLSFSCSLPSISSFSFSFSSFLPSFSSNPVWGLVCLSLIYCFSSTPAREVRLFSHLASSDSWRSSVSNEGVVTLSSTSFTDCAAGWAILFSP